MARDEKGGGVMRRPAAGTTDPGTPVVCLKQVSFSYDTTPVIEMADLDIYPGEFACMVGPNGGGKSTLLRLILGLLRPGSGEVHVFGEAPVRVRYRIGYTPQHIRFDPLFPVTVQDVVLMGRLEHCFAGAYSKKDRDAAHEALESVDLVELRQRPFAALSGGQRQRTLIARALAGAPELLLLDEPLANIDAAAGQKLIELLKELHRQITILMVSHDLHFVTSMVSSVICVNRKVQVHPTSDMSAEIFEELYGADIRLIRHEHRRPGGEHHHG
jgi:zinc transport system ATP-binding protein